MEDGTGEEVVVNHQINNNNDEEEQEELLNVETMADAMNTFFRMIPSSCVASTTLPPILEALQKNERDHAINLIDEGADPFAMIRSIFLFFEDDFLEECVTAFHKASAQKDLEMLLLMAAAPKTNSCSSAWNQRFLISQNQMKTVPITGRECIKSVGSYSGNFFFSPVHASMEGLEVMLMYGYTLKSRDFEYSLCPLAFSDPQNNIRLIKFALAASSEHLLLTTQEKDAEGEETNNNNTCSNKIALKLDYCLGMAIGGSHYSFTNGMHPTSLELAEIFLKAGANPNGYCFQGETPYDYNPALYQAFHNKDKAMVQLLLAYGADVSNVAQFSQWIMEDNGRQSLDVSQATIQSKAEEVGMADLLFPALLSSGSTDHTKEEIKTVANPAAYIQELRREFEAPLKKLIGQEYSPILVVAMMRATNGTVAPPVGMMSKLIIEYWPLGFDFWKISLEN